MVFREASPVSIEQTVFQTWKSLPAIVMSPAIARAALFGT